MSPWAARWRSSPSASARTCRTCCPPPASPTSPGHPRTTGSHRTAPRTHQTPAPSHPPYLLLCADALDADTAWQFADLIDKTDTLPVTSRPRKLRRRALPHADLLNASLDEPHHWSWLIPHHSAAPGPRGLPQITTGCRLGTAAEPARTLAARTSRTDSPPARARAAGRPGQPRQPVHRTNGVPAPAGTWARWRCSRPCWPPPPTRTRPARRCSTPHPTPEKTVQGPGRPPPQVPRSWLKSLRPASTKDTTGRNCTRRRSGSWSHRGGWRGLHRSRPADGASGGAAVLPSRSHRRCAVRRHGPTQPWTPATLNARLQGLRRALGNDPTGPSMCRAAAWAKIPTASPPPSAATGAISFTSSNTPCPRPSRPARPGAGTRPGPRTPFGARPCRGPNPTSKR